MIRSLGNRIFQPSGGLPWLTLGLSDSRGELPPLHQQRLVDVLLQEQDAVGPVTQGVAVLKDGLGGGDAVVRRIQSLYQLLQSLQH